MYSEGTRYKKSVPVISLYSNSRLLLPQMAQLRNTRDEVRHIMAHRLILYVRSLNFALVGAILN